jgi:diadenosine tetraphosphate (Ap4A) HIT family hydrolase
MFVPPREFTIHETPHWRINQRIDVALPGYLMLGACDPAAVRFEYLSTEALKELGPLLRDTVAIIEKALEPKHVYVSRFGHSPGQSIHFHIIPVYSWVIEAFQKDNRYRVLEAFYRPGLADRGFDGPDMNLFISREFAESLTPPRNEGPSMDATLGSLREAFALRLT